MTDKYDGSAEGPWNCDGVGIIFDKDHRIIGAFSRPFGGEPVRAVNRALIVAAPELLAIVRRLAGWAAPGPGDTHCPVCGGEYWQAIDGELRQRHREHCVADEAMRLLQRNKEGQ